MHAEERHQTILRTLRERGGLRVTDIAKEMGVSTVTVRRDVESLAEQGLVRRVHGGAVLPETASQGGDHPAARARGLLRPRPLSFGMIVPDASYYYPEVIKGAREAAASRGIRLVLGITQYDPDEDHAQARQMLDDGIDGLLISPSGRPEERRWIAELGVPAVLVERRQEDDGTVLEQAASDHAHGARLAVRHLAGIGRSRIALLMRADSPHATPIHNGYLAGMAAAGLEAPPDLRFIIPMPDSPGGGDDYEHRIGLFLDAVAAGRIDAALVHNDRDAILLLQRLRAHHVTVPGDMAIVAYDDEVAALADIPLSAIAPPKHGVGSAAVDLLALRVTDPYRPPHRLSILPELHVRASSAVGRDLRQE